MVQDVVGWIATLLENEALIAMLLFAGTAIVIALWVPGVLLPIAASSGALLGIWPATAAVALGALLGSMITFTLTRRYGERVRFKLERYSGAFEGRIRTHGPWCIAGLRLIGAPHFLVSASSALVPIRPAAFALATLLGSIPTILLAAMAGSAISFY